MQDVREGSWFIFNLRFLLELEMEILKKSFENEVYKDWFVGDLYNECLDCLSDFCRACYIYSGATCGT